MPYPGRGAWKFTNLDRAFDFWPRLTSVSIKQENITKLTTLDLEVVLDGDNAGAVFANEDHCEALFRGSPIWRGHLKGVEESSSSDVGPAVYTLAGQDYTSKLDDIIIRRRVERKAETVRRRVRWILSYTRPNIWEFDGIDLSGLPAGNPRVEAYDYYGATLREALEHVSGELRLFFYVDLDNVFHIFRSDSLTAPFGLDNEAPDFATTFPFREWVLGSDSDALANAVLVEPRLRRGSRWSRDAASVAAYGRQERFISDQNLRGHQAALNVGARALAQSAWPQEDGRLICWEPGLAAGQVVHVREALWDHDFDRTIKAVELRAVDPHDASGEAYLQSIVELTDRHRPGTLGGGGTATNKVIRGRPGQTVDTGPYPVDDFDRVVTPPTVSAGAAIPGLELAGVMRIGRSHGEFPGDYGPTWLEGATDQAASYLGNWYNGHTSRPSYTACSGLDNAFTGFQQREQWWRVTVPAHPADAAGITVTMHAGEAGGVQGPGYGEVMPLEVVARSGQPTDVRQGSVLGTVAANGDLTVTIPMSVVPAAGGVLYIGFRTSWECDAKDDTYAYACGWTWPFMCNAGNLDYAGVEYCGHSGQINHTTPTGLAWQVWGAAEADLGETATPTSAPWEGPSTWLDGGSEGEADAWSMDGADFVLSADTPSGKGIYVVGSREDDDQPAGVWSDMHLAQLYEFRIDAHGDTAASGTRHLEATVTGEGESMIGRVHLGDQLRDEGISVLGPTVEDYIAKALTLDETWRAKFDTRSRLYVRGKLWRLADGEPAAWDVQAPLSETEDQLDRLAIWLRAGNVGTTQTLRLRKMTAYAGAVVGQRIVKEFIGYASGTEKRFTVAHPYQEGSLRGFVNGAGVAPNYQDGANGEFGIDWWPTARSIIRATYVAA